MSLKHRNIIAWILLLAAAISWSTGRSFSRLYENMDAPAATAPSTYWTEETVFPTNDSGELDENETIFPTEPYHVLYELFPGLSAGMTRAVSLVLSFLTVIFAAIGIFFLSAGKPILGPDGSFLVLALISTSAQYLQKHLNYGTLEYILLSMVNTFLFLVCMRELWSWLRIKFASSWYLENRMVKRIHRPQTALVSMGAWLVAVTVFMGFCLFSF